VTRPGSHYPGSAQEALANYVSVMLEDEAVANASNPTEIASGQPDAPLVPQWGSSNFKCLMVDVGGIAIAIPVTKVLGTMAWEHNVVDTTAPIVDTLKTPDGQRVSVIDVARIVLPLDQWPRNRGQGDGGMHPLVLVTNGQFGLLVDRLNGEKTVISQEITWRSEATRRPWLAGTSKSLACVVLDVDALVGLMGAAL